MLAAGEFEITPVGTVMEPTNFPPPGERGGPSLAVSVRNISGLPVKISVRLVGLSPTLDRAVKVRSSVAGGVVLNGPLGAAAEWSKPAGVLRSGQQSTLRMRFKLLEGIPPDLWRGRLDVRQLELRAVRLDGRTAADNQAGVGPSISPTQPAPSSPGAIAPSGPPAPSVSTPPPLAATTP